MRRGGVIAALLMVGSGCTYFLSDAVSPDPNSLFVGCFTGAPALGGQVTLILRTVAVSEPGEPDQLSVEGCFDSQVEDLTETAVVSGATTGDDPFVVTLSGVFPSGTPIELTVTRQPAEAVAAESITIASPEEKLDGVSSTAVCSQNFEQLCPSQLVIR